ncbi:bifunctional hydroxymethylpyrimidine kinase/phosphomethylpyrimidine kinase [Nocardioides sp. LS1]|uniref:bifunctional hydroxymethylpyrimidine kinase/phosphomethylpyrimidine kinase n=1 Tax=Nocardioides sp. LS1 TaxID=1027620 RepID=UPI000F619EBD|nr:bifunctional hydroxymethylpyrimidine kinase/phosphomethylpyrimidine kinase [Nocardioides sp. LS1]GCD91238.1 hydroxymethylpyrimidine/phosphomethylpyrimidine kinase [Nocardioides sp. LS1]
MTPAVALTVAGTDSGGAAGIAADLATFAALGVHGACVVTAVTAQDTTGIRDVHPVPLASVESQLDAVLDDLPVAAVKTGMLGTPEVVELLARRLAGRPLVVDPVLVATSGVVLGDEHVVAAYRAHLLPAATVITPNAHEAAILLGRATDPATAAAALADTGPAVVLTGGGTRDTCTDWLALPGQRPVARTHRSVPTTNDHGTGCTFSAALAAHLARGADLDAAVHHAGLFTVRQLDTSRRWTLGRGRGPVAHTTTHNPAGEPT